MYLNYTKPTTLDRARIGTRVPGGAIEIASFKTKKSFMLDGPLASDTGSSESIIQDVESSQYKEMVKYKRISGLSSPDKSVFAGSMNYDDGVYSGPLTIRGVDFEKFERTISKVHAPIHGTAGGNPISVDLSVGANTDDGYSGTLYLSSLKVKSTSHSSDKTHKYKYYIPVFVGAFNGEGIGSASIEYSVVSQTILGSIETTSKVVSKSTWVKALSNGSFPSELNIHGNLYVYSGENKSVTAQTWVKHYGMCRYWGGGSSRPNNYYGDPDYRFRVNGWTAKGYMTDGLPAPTLDRYTHKKQRTRHNPQKYPCDVGGFWTTNVGEKAGIAWTYDIEAAIPYGGSSDITKGGAVWASAFTKANFPPKGYESDYTGSNHYTNLHPGTAGNSTMNHQGKIITKNGPQKTSLSGFYNSAGWYNKYFRDFILFYKGKTTTTKKEGLYNTMLLEHAGAKIISVSLMAGLISKESSYVIKGGVTNRTYDTTYRGNVFKKEITYSGIATYKGDVYKKYMLKGGTEKVELNSLVVVNSSGYLETESGSTNMKSSYVEITDIAKEGEPMYYKYECKNTINMPLESLDYILTGSPIASVNYNGNYLFELKRKNGDEFTISVLTGGPISPSDNIFIEFLDSSLSTRELISSTLLYSQGIEFAMSIRDDMEYIVRFGDSSSIPDKRRKIAARFKVISSSGKTSKEYDVNVVNRKYALESEKNSFIQDMMQIDITDSDGYVMSASEIVARDSGTQGSLLSDNSFYISVISSSGVVDAYTDIDGTSPVYISTLEDTGTRVPGGGYTGDSQDYKVLVSINNVIRKGFFVKEKGSNIGLSLDTKSKHAPYFTHIHGSSFTTHGGKDGIGITAKYKLVDDTRYDGTLGRPFVKVTQVANITDGTVLKLKDKAIIRAGYIKVKNKNGDSAYSIGHYDVKNNSVVINRDVTGQTILVEYYMIKDYTEYKGYSSSSEKSLLDLNTSFGHKYYDSSSGGYYNSSDLINKTIYIFLRPSTVTLATGEVLVDNTGKKSLYHKIDDANSADEFDSLLGVVYLSNDSSIYLNEITQSGATGGGLLEKYVDTFKEKLNCLYDTSDYVEKHIRQGGVLITSVSGESDIDEIKVLSEKFLPIGALNVIK